MSRSHRLAVVVAALFALACAAPAAQADSIAYVKDGNIWLSTSDGARQFQVTTTGGYSDVTQADDGTMIGLHGVRLHRLDRTGTVLADFDTPVSDTRPAPSKTFYGPFEPAISPDGSKVAYTYYYLTQSQSPTCFPPTCVIGINEGGTGYRSPIARPDGTSRAWARTPGGDIRRGRTTTPPCSPIRLTFPTTT